jgi:hypothetical protein
MPGLQSTHTRHRRPGGRRRTEHVGQGPRSADVGSAAAAALLPTWEETQAFVNELRRMTYGDVGHRRVDATEAKNVGEHDRVFDEFLLSIRRRPGRLNWPFPSRRRD